MNKTQRKQIASIQSGLQVPLQALVNLRELLEDDANSESCLTVEHTAGLETLADQIDDATSPVEQLRDEEEEKFDNMPESLQGGEKGEALEAGKDALDEALTTLEEIVSNLSADFAADTTRAEAVELLQAAEDSLGEAIDSLQQATE